jgi:hypothetical protein
MVRSSFWLYTKPHFERHSTGKRTNNQLVWYRLINYTPQATVVRLLSINAVNAYLTLNVLSITGGFQDPRLLLPGWVSIATV